MQRILRAVAALALLIPPLAVSPAIADAGSESTVWYVPQPSDEDYMRSGDQWDHLNVVFVANLSDERARVAIRAFDSQGRYLAQLSSEHALTAGMRISKTIQGFDFNAPTKPIPFSYVLVVSNRPVIVSANAMALLRPRKGNPGQTLNLCQRVSGVRENEKQLYWFCPGYIELDKYASDGSFQHYQTFMWEYVALVDAPAYPIDCATARPNHFACKQRLPTLTGGGGAGPVVGPNDSGVGPIDPPTLGGAPNPSADRATDVEPPRLLPGMALHINRPGSDYRTFPLASREPGQCQLTCNQERTCRAWTYVHPGVEGANPVCHLKRDVPPRRADTCCISGVKGPGVVRDHREEFRGE